MVNRILEYCASAHFKLYSSIFNKVKKINICDLQAADEPAYLTVGTDVSAKYRGAFCEAKIKTVKRLVKVKVCGWSTKSRSIVELISV